MHVAINILFDKNPPAYFPGEEVTGRILIQSDGPVSSKGLKFKSKGEAYVYWEESKTVSDTDADGKSTSRTETVSYSQEEKYYKNEVHIWGNGSNQDLPTDQFVFRYQIPPNVPASFEGEYGYVRHEIKVKLKSSSFFKSSIKKTVNISVNPHYDLNVDSAAKMPITGEKQKNFCCWCCATGPISFALRIGQSGYVCGQSIFINAECTNASSRKINHTKAAITQSIKYKADGSTKSEVNNVLELQHGEIVSGDSDVWSEHLVIPPVPPSHLSHCSIIDISYQLIFSMDATCAANLNQEWPIIIGTIPLQHNFGNINNLPKVEPTAPALNEQPPPYGVHIYDDCPPPSYAVCTSNTGMKKKKTVDPNSSDEDEEENDTVVVPFRPFYPSFNFTG